MPEIEWKFPLRHVEAGYKLKKADFNACLVDPKELEGDFRYNRLVPGTAVLLCF